MTIFVVDRFQLSMTIKVISNVSNQSVIRLQNEQTKLFIFYQMIKGHLNVNTIDLDKGLNSL